MKALALLLLLLCGCRTRPATLHYDASDEYLTRYRLEMRDVTRRP